MKHLLSVKIAFLGLFLPFKSVFAVDEGLYRDAYCVVQSIQGDTRHSQEFLVDSKSEDPHGAMLYFSIPQDQDISGFLAIMNGILVIHVYDAKVGRASTTHTKMVDGI